MEERMRAMFAIDDDVEVFSEWFLAFSSIANMEQLFVSQSCLPGRKNMFIRLLTCLKRFLVLVSGGHSNPSSADLNRVICDKQLEQVLHEYGLQAPFPDGPSHLCKAAVNNFPWATPDWSGSTRTPTPSVRHLRE